MSAGERALAAARAALGTPFRLHGREPASGLDCVGLAALALHSPHGTGVVPSGYTLRSGDIARVRAAVSAMGLIEAADVQSGDVLLLRAGAGQLHFAIQSGAGIIHADAVLRRVVERPDIPWPVIGRWRIAQGD